jgi:hypothetical protein
MGSVQNFTDARERFALAAAGEGKTERTHHGKEAAGRAKKKNSPASSSPSGRGNKVGRERIRICFRYFNVGRIL